MIRKKILFIITVAIFIFSTFGIGTVYAVADSSTLQIYCSNVILVERKTGKILYEKNARDKIYMASTTKLLTAILVLENCDLNETATVSKTAVDSVPWDYTRANLKPGEQFTVDHLLHVLLIPSANDAANVLAEHVSGSVEEFAKLMNAKAQELGCTGSHFTNPSGLHEEDHYSTAYDLYLIGNCALNFDKIRAIVKETKYTLPTTDKYEKNDRTFVTTNSMIRKDMPKYYEEYITGLKTGFTDFSKDCIVASAEKDGVEYVAVVMGGGYTGSEWLREKYLDCKTLFNFAFDNYKVETIASEGNVCTQLTIGNATAETKSLDIVYESNLQAFIDKSINLSDLKPTIKLKDFIKAPVQKGENLGSATFEIDGTKYTVNLVANSDVVRIPYLLIILRILLIPIILVGLYFILIYTRKKTKDSVTSNNYRL